MFFEARMCRDRGGEKFNNYSFLLKKYVTQVSVFCKNA